jgi:TPR repeat protein
VIHEHWDEVLRLVASLQAGTVLPSAMLQRLAAFQRQNQLDLALQELGRIERTLFMLAQIGARGIRPDPEEAAKWYARARDAGDKNGDALFRRLRPPSGAQ